MWLFGSQTHGHMVEFFGSLVCSERFFSGKKTHDLICTSTRKDYVFANVAREALIFEQT